MAKEIPEEKENPYHKSLPRPSIVSFIVVFTPALKTGFCKLKAGDRMRTPEISAQDWLKRRRSGRDIMALFDMMIREKVN